MVNTLTTPRNRPKKTATKHDNTLVEDDRMHCTDEKVDTRNGEDIDVEMFGARHNQIQFDCETSGSVSSSLPSTSLMIC